MFTFKTYLKAIVVALTVLAGMLAAPISFGINPFILNICPKYQNLERAIVTLSDFKYQIFDNKKNSILFQSDIGFKEFKSMMYNKFVIPYDKKNVTDILIIRAGTYIEISGFEATPQYLLVIRVNNIFKKVTVMYLNDTQNWVQSEKQNDLQTWAFYNLVLAIAIDLISDYIQEIKKYILNIKYKILSTIIIF